VKEEHDTATHTDMTQFLLDWYEIVKERFLPLTLTTPTCNYVLSAV